MGTLPNPMNVYDGPLKTFDQWADFVEVLWLKMLKRAVDDQTARAAMRTANPLFRESATKAYDEYKAGWQRRQRDRRKAERAQEANADG